VTGLVDGIGAPFGAGNGAGFIADRGSGLVIIPVGNENVEM
jgi:hypothetical protein